MQSTTDNKSDKQISIWWITYVIVCNMAVPAPPGLWVCVGELSLLFPGSSLHPVNCSLASLLPAGPRHAAGANSHTDYVAAPFRPAESTQYAEIPRMINAGSKI